MAGASDYRQAQWVWTRRGFIRALGAVTAASGAGWASAARREDAPAQWRDGLAARSVARHEPEYESWRQAMPWQMYTAPRHPDMIVRPDGAAGVPAVLRAARARGLKVAIKSGGHNVSESFLRDGGMLLDLGELQGVEVDPASRTAWVEPALWSHGLLQAIEPHGLAFPVAHCATVPMGGYLLGGGLGYNHDNWGTLACHSILAAEVVLASGETVVASPQSHPDLYWAVRGAGTGFFGVVTRYQLQLYRAPGAVHETAFVFPLSELENATRLLQAWARSGPADTELMMLLAHNPMAPPEAPPAARKLCVVRAVAYSENPAMAGRILGELGSHPLAAGAAAATGVQPTGLRQMAVESVDAGMGLGFGRYAVDTIWTNDLEQVMAEIAAHFASANSMKTHFVISPKLNRTLPRDAAFSMIGDTFVGAYAMWDEAVDDAASFAWLDGASARMRPLAVGQYINEVDAFRDPSAPPRCFSETAWRRLRELRGRYDPSGVLCDFPGSASGRAPA